MDGSLAKPHACHTPATKGPFNNDGSGKWHLEGHMSYTFPLQKDNCPLPCLLDSGWSPDWSVFVIRSRYRASTPPPEALPLRALKVCPDAGGGVQRRALEPPGLGCVAFWIS